MRSLAVLLVVLLSRTSSAQSQDLARTSQNSSAVLAERQRPGNNAAASSGGAEGLTTGNATRARAAPLPAMAGGYQNATDQQMEETLKRWRLSPTQADALGLPRLAGATHFCALVGCRSCTRAKQRSAALRRPACRTHVCAGPTAGLPVGC